MNRWLAQRSSGADSTPVVSHYLSVLPFRALRENDWVRVRAFYLGLPGIPGISFFHYKLGLSKRRPFLFFSPLVAYGLKNSNPEKFAQFDKLNGME